MPFPKLSGTAGVAVRSCAWQSIPSAASKRISAPQGVRRLGIFHKPLGAHWAVNLGQTMPCTA
ncbi:Protein of unknown function [Gryllus bimaculatus]|nr:Protein of unknown function [Gryllus bimaculatus]